MSYQLQFVASMTVSSSDIRKIKSYLQLAQPTLNPLSKILVTPLFMGNDSLGMIKTLAQEQGSEVVFDSGGYYVQMGKISYERLYLPLLDVYSKNMWASLYTLPDHVPISKDSEEVVRYKVENTITYSNLFYHEMPDELRSKAMPVVQGRTQSQIDRCLNSFIKMGVRWIGFGSFGTSGANNEVNVATFQSINLARYVIEVAHQHGIKVHIFGVGAPALVAMLSGIGADSFDSAGWLKAAGYGMISLPLMRYWNITYQNQRSDIQKGIPVEEFYKLRQITKHQCELCNNIYSLQKIKMYRAVHNLISTSESVRIINERDAGYIQYLYANGSPKYREEYTKWLQTH